MPSDRANAWKRDCGGSGDDRGGAAAAVATDATAKDPLQSPRRARFDQRRLEGGVTDAVDHPRVQRRRRAARAAAPRAARVGPRLLRRL